jgi:hypothetical protein
MQSKTMLSKALFGMFLVLGLANCSQNRRAFDDGKAAEELWTAVEVCSDLACFQIQPDITNNKAYVDVIDIAYDPKEVSYRVLVRRQNDSVWHLVKDNVSVDIGGSFEFTALNGHRIHEYEEYAFELTAAPFNNDQNDWRDATPGSGLLLVQQIVSFPEAANLTKDDVE